MKSGKVLLGILIGIAGGVMSYILLVPDKFKLTQKKIAEKREDYANAVKGKFYELLGGMSVRYKKAQKEMKGYAMQARSTVKKEYRNAKDAAGIH